LTGILVLVTGTGRSGTSTIAGSLFHLGLSVPGPYLGANASNPKGFFESSWALRFHKQIERAARINDFDAQPSAFERAQHAVTPELRSRLIAFLGRHAGEGVQIVVKDPRSVWVQRLWKEAAAEVGLDIGYLSMLRHPAEVVGSRATYYAANADTAQRIHYEICSVARWVNSSLVSERETRGEMRTFVLYADLLEDWRSALTRVRDELHLTFNSDLVPGGRHPVDEFIDPSLRRLKVTWDDLRIPAELQEIAEEMWSALLRLRASPSSDDGTLRDLDELSRRYAHLFADAQAISHDAIDEARREGDHKGARKARKEQMGKRSTPASASPTVAQASGRELLRAVRERVGRRIRRR